VAAREVFIAADAEVAEEEDEAIETEDVQGGNEHEKPTNASATMVSTCEMIEQHETSGHYLSEMVPVLCHGQGARSST
jgi:hypothetical protein